MSLMNLILFFWLEREKKGFNKVGTKLLDPTFELDGPLEICEWPYKLWIYT